MRVTILGRHFPPAMSGIGDHTDLLASELARRGATVTVVCSPPAESRASFAVHPVVQRWDAAGYPGIARAVAATHPDAILWQYNPFAVGRHGIALGVARLAKTLAASAPLIVFCHELWFPWGREGARGLLWALAQRAQAAGVLRAARRAIVTTESRERALRRYGPKIVRIPVGTNVEPRATEPAAARARLGIPADAFVVAHLGGLGPGRDPEPAFAALATLRARGLDAHLLLIGTTGPFRRPAAIEDGLHLTGPGTREELSAALSASDVYLHMDRAGPSAGRRTTLVAALAHGLPIVSYRGPDHASELIEGRSVVTVEPTPDALARALGELAANPDIRRALGRAARETFDANFAWTRIGERLMDVLSCR